jgi:hypothetical protein
MLCAAARLRIVQHGVWLLAESPCPSIITGTIRRGQCFIECDVQCFCVTTPRHCVSGGLSCIALHELDVEWDFVCVRRHHDTVAAEHDPSRCVGGPLSLRQRQCVTTRRPRAIGDGDGVGVVEAVSVCGDTTTLSQLRAVMCGSRMTSVWSGTLCACDDTTTLLSSRAAWELSMTRVDVWTVRCP